MTVREYRKGDWVGVADLWKRNPSEEFPLLGLDPDAVGAVLRRSEGPGLQFVLRLARLFGRPLFVVWVVDVGGRVAGTTLLNFTREASYVSGVVVDASLRRQGHAREMLRACDDLSRRYHRAGVVLDVLSQNAPAIRLYDKWGYEQLRDTRWVARTLGDSAPLPPPSGATRIRPYAPRDGRPLAEMDNALMPTEVRRFVPRHARDFQVPRTVLRVLQSETEAWVAELDGKPVGFLRSTVSRLMQAANVTAPVIGADVPEPVARDLYLTALRWSESRKAPRVFTEVPEHQWRWRPLLDSLGFEQHFVAHTLVHRLAA